MTCPTCGAPNASGNFCSRCGAPLPRDSDAAAPPRALRTPLQIVVGIVAILIFLCTVLLVVLSVPDPVALALSAAAAIVPAVVYSGLVLSLDRYEQEPRKVLLGAFGWGAVGAVFFSAITELVSGVILIGAVGEDAGTFLNVGVGAPFIEETFKGLALLVLLVRYRSEFDNVLDGLVYGALIGLGFAMTENILYFGNEYREDGMSGLGELFVARAIIGGFGHALYTGTTGAAVGWARSRYQQGALRFVVPVVGWGLAVFQHFLWNTGAYYIAGRQGDDASVIEVVLIEAPLFILPSLIILYLIAQIASNRELRIIREQLADEVWAGVLTQGEYDVLSDQRRRRDAARSAFRRGGPPAWALQRRFFSTAAELAFRKYHVSRGEPAKGAPRALAEDEYRARIAALRPQLAAAGVSIPA